MANIDGPDAIRRLNLELDRNNAGENGPIPRLGQEILSVARKLYDKVDATGKAAKGSVAVEFKLHGYQQKNGVIAIDLEAPALKIKEPAGNGWATRIYVSSDGDVTTHEPPDPRQLEAPGILRPIDGGKKEEAPAGAGKKVV